MNIVLWVVQVLLAGHTAMGGVWKFSNSAEEAVPTLSAIPHGVWLAMGGFELVLALCLVVPAISSSLGFLVPIAAVLIAAEMLLFAGLHLASGHSNNSPVVYWMVVAVVCAFLAYGRFVLRPL